MFKNPSFQSEGDEYNYAAMWKDISKLKWSSKELYLASDDIHACRALFFAFLTSRQSCYFQKTVGRLFFSFFLDNAALLFLQKWEAKVTFFFSFLFLLPLRSLFSSPPSTIDSTVEEGRTQIAKEKEEEEEDAVGDRLQKKENSLTKVWFWLQMRRCWAYFMICIYDSKRPLKQDFCYFCA